MIEEVLRREKESWEQGLKCGVVGVLYAELVIGGVIFLVLTLFRVWL